jgi:ubiquinone biosynthesis accessory factor UbiJ
MMITLMAMALEGIIQRYLRLDTVTREKLAALSGKVILFDIDIYPRIELYMFPCAQGVRLQSAYEGLPDVMMTGSLASFAKRGLKKDDAVAFPRGIEVEGDMDLAQKINRILLDSHIDWEEILSVLTNDNIAHYMSDIVQHFKRFKSKVKKNLQENITEYLQEEARLLPSHVEVEDFFSDIYTLKNDVERLEAALRCHPE